MKRGERLRLREKLSKREASGATILIFIIITVQALLFLINLYGRRGGVKDDVEEEHSSELIVEEHRSELIAEERLPEEESTLFTFDPNSVTVEELVLLGLSERQAATIINYRLAGGRFRVREDFLKMYVVSETLYESVKEYIVIAGPPLENDRSSTPPPPPGAETPLRGELPLREELPLKEEPALGENLPLRRESPALIEINHADSLTLLSLPGIGPYYASRILAYRARVGGFYRKEQLMEISGIDEDRYAMFRERIYADTASIPQIDLAAVSLEEISAHPYVGAYLARSIIRFREQTQSERITLELLLKNRIINSELFEILKYYFL